MTRTHITSATNPRVKNVVRLRDRTKRKKGGLTIVEGGRELLRALEAGVTFHEIFICPELLENFQSINEKLSSLEAAVYETTKAVFSKLSYGNRCEGILGVCAPQELSLSAIPKKALPVILIVEAVEKPGNLGAILRTCDGAAVDGVIICDSKTDVYNPNVIRASLGTVFSVPVIVSTNEEALAYCKERNIRVCATTPSANSLYTKLKLNDAVAVVVGSEQSGLSQFWIDHADIKVKIPMMGQTDSLNVSASTAVLLYEIIRQRSK